jgi:hypothetical protein
MAWVLRMLQESKGKDETDEIGELPNGSEFLIEDEVLPNGDVPVLPADEADGSFLLGYGYGYGAMTAAEADGATNFLGNTLFGIFICAFCFSLIFLAQQRNARRMEFGAVGRGAGTVLAGAANSRGPGGPT